MNKFYFSKKKLILKLKNHLGLKNVMSIPKLDKIVLNMGVGKAISNKKYINNAVNDLEKISGQKPIITKAKKSISNFKLRKGYPIGCKVTLRSFKMENFLIKLVKVVIPRIRDFRGFSKKSFDGYGNYNFGIKEQFIFPEIKYDSIDEVRGLNITISTSTFLDKYAKSLLKIVFNFPFRK